MRTSRRCFIMTGLTVLPLRGADFWKLKSPADWSPKEIQKLLTNSPWAKTASVEFNMPAMGEGPGGMGGPPPGGPGGSMGPPPGGSGGDMGGPPGFTSMNLTVVWESAEPVRVARKSEAADAALNTYVLGLSGLPALDGSRSGRESGEGRRPNPLQMIDQLKQTAKLSRKAREPLMAASVKSLERDSKITLLLTFEEASQPIDLDDKNVEFSARMGPLQIRAVFIPKDMVLQGKLKV